MLGHIFENLLEDNKDKGAFYTPKEIVHDMCQESLIEYLCTTLQIKDEAKEREAITALLKTKEIDEVLKTEITNINKALEITKKSLENAYFEKELDNVMIKISN